MATILNDIYEIVDRSIYEAIRLVLVEHGYLPDISLFPNTPAGVSAWETAISTIVATKGFAIELFGAGSSDAKYSKRVPRIVYFPKRIKPGDLGGNMGKYYELDANNNYKALSQPPSITNYGFEISLVAKNSKQLRVMDSVMSVVLSRRGYIKLYNDATQEFFVIQNGYREYPDTDYGLLEYIYSYEAQDLWDRLEISPTPISPLKEISVEVRGEGTPDSDTADSSIIYP